MSVKISGVEKGSPCAKKRIRAGDILISVNGREIGDVLDYRFYTSDDSLILRLHRENGRERKVKIKNSDGGELGLCFETYLMDRQRSCRNNCVFCFIDQLPKGLRESLYFKDDDQRLSFLFGNYVTLTNFSERDIERIIEMHISPVNVSVHTMNPDLRVKMMRNKNAGSSLAALERFAGAGISINTQLVLCPGINDGDELDFSLRELAKLAPALSSIAAVPVGLTAHRDGLYPLRPFSPEEAKKVISAIDAFNEECASAGKGRLAYAADEFFICAGLEMPDCGCYDDFPQLENGVGMWSLLLSEFREALENADLPTAKREITLATGEAAYPLLQKTVDELTKKCNNILINLVKIKNNFFGGGVTVAGLLTGSDLLRQLSGKTLGEELLIPACALRREDEIFLDGMSLGQLSDELGVKITPVGNSGTELLSAVTGKEQVKK